MIHSAYAWVSAHPLLAYLGVSAVLTSLWYAVRGAVWQELPTSRLPVGARVVQAIIECLVNLPGAWRAATGSDRLSVRPSRVPPVLPVLMLVALAAGLAGCPVLPPSDGCRPLATRCSPAGVPQTCSPGVAPSGARWTGLPLAVPCAQAGGVCCWTHGHGADLYACTAPANCLPDPVTADGGVL